MAGSFVELNGIVLSSSNIGEYDKRIVVLTKERGKTVMFVRGARKMNSPLVAPCQTFAYGSFRVFCGKNYNLNEAEIKDYFVDLREDIDRLYMALYFCEMAEHFTVEGSPDVDILNLLYMALNALRKKQMRVGLIRLAYEIRIMECFGMGIEAGQCVSCGKVETEENHVLKWFSPKLSGVLCDDCIKNESGLLPVSGSTLYALQYILSVPLNKLFSFDLKKEVSAELSDISKAYLKVQVEHRFKTLDFIEGGRI